MREIAEGADDQHRLPLRHAVEDVFQLAARGLVIVAMEAQRGATDPLHQIEDRLAFLVAYGIAEDAPEQPDIIAQPGILGGIVPAGIDRPVGE